MASIRKIEGKGGVSYKITVSMGRDAQDKQIRHFKTWKPDRPMTARQMEKEVQRVALEFEREITLGFQADNRQTFAQYAAYVYSLQEQRGDKPQTLHRIKRQTARINEHIGHMKLADIRPQHLTALYKKLSEPGQNRWRVYAVPAVDFNELRGTDNYNEFAEKCGVYGRLIANLCRGQQITRKNAAIIEQHLGRKDLFKIVGNDTPLSPGTIRDYHGVIYAILAQAEREMIIPYNPAEKVTLPPKSRVRPSDSLQPEQVQNMLEALEGEPLDIQTMLTLFIATGCRRGEIMGLRWEKVDFATGQLKIDRCLHYLPDRGVFEGATKTNNTRYIVLPKEAVALLRKYRAWQIERRLAMGDQWQDTGYVFTRADGTALNPNTANLIINKFCNKYGFPRIHPHTFRHTAASILLSNGIDVLTVSKMLGHADTSTTLDTYGHAIEEAKRKAAECISDAILRKKQA